ncbi:predicted protein [Scheffersomyces stipitis CBS 6054]|uniref:Uncharacterized protein n=1 Tax=Scheffersomyces stipitis (strain ATCC 58785 / CBS 6054 / NBRC 10063 / NRRL Y-11545) TaxID=322104 RepID=A3LZQ6_PICST|nr:predicted protein [Scheffersomyces stipitis CBS 6054]ABN68583.2 predicted protein [Scheffersomyces stipitis CBS 6054]
MTSTQVSMDQLPNTAVFLNSVAPGFTSLDSNVHFSLENEPLNNGERSITWPLTGTNQSTIAILDNTYLNISRVPLNPASNESTTYVSLPYHVTNLFKKVVKQKDKESEGNMHIGANINPLAHDPFKVTQLNPGCLSDILEVNNLSLLRRRSSNRVPGEDTSKSTLNQGKTFNKLTSNFNRLLRITATGTSSSEIDNTTSSSTDHYQNLLNFIEPIKVPLSNFLIEKVTSYNSESYSTELRDPSTSKLLISAHINVLNVITMDTEGNYKNTKSVNTSTPILPYLESYETDESKKMSEYQKVIEEPALRIHFRQNSIITALKTFVNKSREPIVILGFDSGEVIIINLHALNYQIFDDLGFGQMPPNPDNVSISSKASSHIYSSSFGNVDVTALEIFHHPLYEYLIVAGYSNGEVMILDPYASRSNPSTNNQSEEKLKKSSKLVGKDAYISYFKKFDLSPFCKKASSSSGEETDSYSPNYLVGHFRVSYKPITAISSTMPYSENTDFSHSEVQPMILAIGADDGLVRFMDLIFTHDKSYGNTSDIKNNSVLTDLLSNYFNDGITGIEFSPDFRFVCIVGKGDIIEIFKMTYYNVNGLLTKNTGSNYHSSTNVNGLNPTSSGVVGRRSRSGTLNSVNSANLPSAAMFLSPSNTTPSNSFDISRNEHNHTPRLLNTPLKELYPPLIKEIRIVGRFKGHTNTIKKIRFIKEDEFNKGDLEQEASVKNSVYKLISCGFDGKIIIWEFDYKALPKVKKLPPLEKEKENKEKISTHKRRSIHENTQDQIEILTSLYKSLFDLRLKRHYKALAKKAGLSSGTKRYSTVIPPIVNDKLVPSIEVPLMSLDLSALVSDGKIDGFFVDAYNLWCFGKSGDIFRYCIG